MISPGFDGATNEVESIALAIYVATLAGDAARSDGGEFGVSNRCAEWSFKMAERFVAERDARRKRA